MRALARPGIFIAMPLASRSIDAKSGLSKAVLPESFMVSLYRALAPYRGCAHGCAYCDGRAEKYFVEGDFARDIAVRHNIVERIQADVSSGIAATEFGAVALGSGVTDVYQPLEREERLTRGVLEALVPAGLPIAILTKNDLVARDFDLLERFPAALVMTTITTTDEAVAARLEPGASPPAARLAFLKEARTRGFHTGIMAMPLCPGISDTAASFGAVLDVAVDAGAEFVWPGGLTLRPGRQKDLFHTLLDAHWPALRGDNDLLYGENRPSGMPLATASRALLMRLDTALRERSIPAMPPLSLYRDLLSLPDALFVLLCHMQGLYNLRGVDTRPLKAATDRYADWLRTQRKALRRRRADARQSGQAPFWRTSLLEERLKALCSPQGLPVDVLSPVPGAALPRRELEPCLFELEGPPIQPGISLEDLLGNEKLAALLRAIVCEGKDFSYSSLSLVPALGGKGLVKNHIL